MQRSSSSRSLQDVDEEGQDEPTPLRHARQHSRIHARNLSEFFPRPGQPPGLGYGGTYEQGSPSSSSIKDISHDDGGGGASPLRAQNRRGHHHRHSVSHNLFPFLEPPTSPSSPSRSPSSPSPSSSSSLLNKFGSLPLFLQLPLFALVRLPLTSQIALLISISQMTLGATLWIQGQSGESLSVTGLGYLVVFDGLGSLSKLVLARRGALESWKLEMGGNNLTRGVGRDEDLQQPFGLVRLSTLSCFSQAIYLLFSAVYVCKESIEHVLLLHGPAEGEGSGHGAGHGAVGHGEGRTGGGANHSRVEPINFPLVVLLLSATLAIVSAVCFKTHSELSNLVHLSSSSPTTATTKKYNRGGVLNPFTMTVAGFGIGLFGAAIVLPPAQLSPLDKILSLLVSLSMFYIAYPAALSTGKILLQTAPPEETKEARGIHQGFKDIANHPLVLSIETSHVWQLVPSSSSPVSSLTKTTTNDTDEGGGGPSTIVTLTVLVKPDVDEKGILELSKWVRERCENAGNPTPSSSSSSQSRREVTVEIKRSKQG